jgi:hypothetical protein
LVQECSILYIFFKNSIVIASALPEEEYEQVVHLNNPDNKILGFGSFYSRSQGSGNDVCSSIVICSDTQFGILQIDVLPSHVHTLPPSSNAPVEKSAEYIRLNLEQAVFYGQEMNPLSFDISELDGNFEMICLEMSAALVDSHSKHLSSFLDLRSHLNERLTRLNVIPFYLHQNQLLDALGDDFKWQLYFNAEKVAVGLGLWNYQNSLLNDLERKQHEPTFVMLSNAIKQLMDDDSLDSLRLFFKYSLNRLPELLELLQIPTRRQISSPFSQEYTLLIHESSRIMILLFKSALEFRRDYSFKYHLCNHPCYEPWLASLQILDQLQYQYELIESILCKFPNVPGAQSLQDLSMDQHSPISSPTFLQNDLRNQLCDLADILLGAYSERIAFLTRYFIKQ